MKFHDCLVGIALYQALTAMMVLLEVDWSDSGGGGAQIRNIKAVNQYIDNDSYLSYPRPPSRSSLYVISHASHLEPMAVVPIKPSITDLLAVVEGSECHQRAPR